MAYPVALEPEQGWLRMERCEDLDMYNSTVVEYPSLAAEQLLHAARVAGSRGQEAGSRRAKEAEVTQLSDDDGAREGDILAEIVRRIVQVAAPERIILFGSAARGDVTGDSDVDLLVIKAGAHRRKLAQAIYRRLLGVGQAVDVVVVTPEDVERYRNAPGLVIAPALQEGRVLYAA